MKLIEFFYCVLYVFILCFCTSLFSGVHELKDHGILDYSCVIGEDSGKNIINIYLNHNTIIKSKNANLGLGSSDCDYISMLRLPMAVVGKKCRQAFWFCKGSEVGEIKKEYSKLNFILPDDVDSYELFTSENNVVGWFAISNVIDRSHYDERVLSYSCDELKLELDYDLSLCDNITITMNPSLVFNILSQVICLDISELEILEKHKWFSKFRAILTCEGSLADDSACVIVRFLPKSHYDLTLCTDLSIKTDETDVTSSNSSVTSFKEISMKFSHCNEKVKKLVKLQCSMPEEVYNKDEYSTNEINVNATKHKDHTAKIKEGEWPLYGNAKNWSELFEISVESIKSMIDIGDLKGGINIINKCVEVISKIAIIRDNECADKFGLQRDKNITDKISYTCLGGSTLPYGYVLPRVLKIPYDGKFFVNSNSNCGYEWLKTLNAYDIDTLSQDYKYHDVLPFRYGLVQSYIKNMVVPLTQYIFCMRTKESRNYEIEEYFGNYDSDYIGDNNESAIWLHTDRNQSKKVLKHIAELVDKAISGDLSVIPRIHWWYVHLAPDWRGSGGVAEILTNTLCRLHNVDLPAWADGVAPSVETLIEPNEEKYCFNYHLLFEEDQDKLQILFKAPMCSVNDSYSPTVEIKEEVHSESVTYEQKELPESLSSQMSTLNI